MTGLAPGAILEGRYRIDHVVSSEGGAYLLGTALESGASVRVLELPPLVLRSLGRAQKLEHPNLCTVIEAIPRPGGHGLAVVEHVFGRTLADRLAAERVLATDTAVVTALDLADALVGLHQRGAAHGLLTPASVVIEPQGRSGVVLAHAPSAPPPNPYHCPERGIGPPSPADDVWALASLLHQMLLGAPPPSAGYRSREEVEATGVEHADLVLLLGNCLARRPENRVSMAHAVRDLLASWVSAAHSMAPPASVEPPESVAPAGPASVPPARLPSERPPPAAGADGAPSTPPAAQVAAPPPRSSSRARGLGMLLVGGGVLLVGLLVATAIFGMDRVRGLVAGVDSATVSVPASPAGASAAAPTAVISAVAAAASGARPPASTPSHELRGADLTACVVEQLPPNSFKAPPNFDWLCSVTDPRRGYSRLRSALVLGAKGDVTQAMSLWSRVRWYGMASFTVIRAACCADPPPLELPRTASCGPTEDILNELHDVVIAGKDHVPVLDRYTRNVRCHSQQGRDRFFGVDGELGGGQRTAFDELMQLRTP